MLEDIFGDSDSEDENLPEFVDDKEAEDLEETGKNKLMDLLSRKDKQKKKRHREDSDAAGEEGSSSRKKRSRKDDDGGEKKRRRSESRKKRSAPLELPIERSHYDQTDPERVGQAAPVPMDEGDELEMAMKRITSRRKKKKEVDTNKLNYRHEMIVQNMRDAFEEDKRLNLAQQPALNKIKLLSEVERELKVKDRENTDSMLNNNILSVIREWLEPLPDKSLPNVKIREVLLEYLERQPQIDRDQLKNSGIGKAIMFLWKHPDETPKNKKVAQKIIEEWSRPIFGLSANYSDLRSYSPSISRPTRIDTHNELAPAKANLEAALESKSKSSKVGDSGYSLHARIPQKMAFDFVLPPPLKVSEAEFQNKKDEAKLHAQQFHRLNKHLQQRRKPTQKNIRAVKPSIEGR